MSPVLDSIGSVKGYGWGSFSSLLPSFESIATATVSGTGTNSVSFTSIPSTYKHLQIRVTAKWNYTLNADQSNIIIRINGDTGANYSYRSLVGNGSAVSTGGGTGYTFIYFQTQIVGNYTTETSIYSGSVIDILDYGDTNKFKTIRGMGGFDRSGSGWVGLASGMWSSTNAVTSITLTNDFDADWIQYSSFALYGIKG